MFPVEFASYDAERQYVTFKTKIPADGIAALKPLKPGEWVTAASPRGSSSEAEPIMAIKPFVSTPGSGSNELVAEFPNRPPVVLSGLASMEPESAGRRK